MRHIIFIDKEIKTNNINVTLIMTVIKSVLFNTVDGTLVQMCISISFGRLVE